MRPNPQVQTTLARPLNPDAYDAYLRGQFAKAIQLDPYWAQAYVGLSNQLYLPALFWFTPPQPAFSQMLDAALKAVEPDETMADAHATLALARLHTQWKWDAAEAGFRRAIQLEPNNPGVRHGFAHFLLWEGRGKESAEQCNLAQELDPFDADLLGCRAWHDLWAGEYDSAIDYSRRALSLDPKEFFAPLVMGWTYEQKGMFQEAISSFQKMAPGPSQTASVVHALARSGRPQAARDYLAHLLQVEKEIRLSLQHRRHIRRTRRSRQYGVVAPEGLPRTHRPFGLRVSGSTPETASWKLAVSRPLAWHGLSESKCLKTVTERRGP